MTVMSIESRASEKAGVDRSEGSEQRQWKTYRQQEFAGRSRSDLRRFKLISPTSDNYTNANFVKQLAEAKSGRATALRHLMNVDSGESNEDSLFSATGPLRAR